MYARHILTFVQYVVCVVTATTTAAKMLKKTKQEKLKAYFNVQKVKNTNSTQQSSAEYYNSKFDDAVLEEQNKNEVENSFAEIQNAEQSSHLSCKRTVCKYSKLIFLFNCMRNIRI